MQLKDVILLLLGAATGAAANSWYNHLSKKASDIRRKAHDRKRRRGCRRAARSLVQLYITRGWTTSIYTTSQLAAPMHLPVLYDSQFDPVFAITLNDNRPIVMPPGKTARSVRPRLIKSAVRQGARVFDGEALFCTRIRRASDYDLEFEVAQGSFLGAATLALQIQRSVRHRPLRSSFHERHMKTFRMALEELSPLPLGCSCVTVFHTAANQKIVAIASRSSEVLLGPGLRTVLPNFGLESNTLGRAASNFGLLFYNFAREFAEELFDLEQLVQTATTGRAHPDWLFTLPPAARLLEEADNGRLQVHCLGVSLSATDGYLNFSLLAEFTSADFYSWLRHELKAGWESASSQTGEPPVQFVDLHDPILDKWATDNILGPSTAVALDLARRHYGPRLDS